MYELTDPSAMLECLELFAFWALDSFSLHVMVGKIIPEKSQGVLLSLLSSQTL